MPEARAVRALLVYPRFGAETFWSFTESCELMGVQRTAPPLGLITVAALLPAHWQLRLVDCNLRALTDEDIDGVDLVLTGGMLPQQADTFRIIERCRERGTPVIVGGPDVSSSPHLYARADHRFVGEAEGALQRFVDDFEAGTAGGLYEAERFKADVSSSPVPRHDLLDPAGYLYMSVQFARGCPFTCEFCDIIELYGRAPRTKGHEQLLRELDALYRLGWRGHVDFVDDNFIGNKKNVKQLLPHLIDWQRRHGYPFEFSTEASLNLADDPALLEQMKQARFFTVFVGIESPDDATLTAMRKKQNTRRSLLGSLQTLYAAGLTVSAGFIVGFDTESPRAGAQLAEFIELSGIPVCMVGLLYALPNTQLTRRLAAEGRLHADHDRLPQGGDQCTVGLNYEPARPLADILGDYRRILQAIYEPRAYIARVGRLLDHLRLRPGDGTLHPADRRNRVDQADVMRRILREVPEARDALWALMRRCAREQPEALRTVVGLMVLYLHLRPYAQQVVAAVDRRLAALQEPGHVPPARVPVPATPVPPAARPLVYAGGLRAAVPTV